MEISFHYMLMASHMELQKQVFTQLKDTDLTPGQPKILDYLMHKDGVNQREIADCCRIEPASVTAILGGMEQKGLIQRKPVENDRRTLQVRLTERGRQLGKQVQMIFGQIENKLKADIPPAEWDAFLIIFKRVYEHLTQEGIGWKK